MMFLKRITQVGYFIIWLGVSLIILYSLILSTLAFFSLIGGSKTNSQLYFAAFGELLRVALTGWFFFTLFQTPGSRGIIPSEHIREHPIATIRLFFYWILVVLWRVIILNVSYRFAGIEIKSPVTQSWLTVITAFALLQTALAIFATTVGIKRRNKEAEALLADVSLISRALDKLRASLSEEENLLLQKYIYEDHLLEQTGLNRLFGVTGLSLIFTLLIALAQELFLRL